jgi:hypothetical protein
MDEQTSKSNRGSSKLAYERKRVLHLVESLHKWGNSGLQAQEITEAVEARLLNLTSEEQLLLRKELFEKARDHLHDIIIGGIDNRIREDLEQEVRQANRIGNFFFGGLRAEVSLETQIRMLEEKKAKQRALEEELLLAKQRLEGSRSPPRRNYPATTYQEMSNFVELRKAEVRIRRTPLLGSTVNKGKKKG